MATSVRRATTLTPTFVELVLGGGDLARFEPSPYADSYVKVLFPAEGVERPQQRSYTVRSWDPDSRELTLVFVVHGDDGLAGPWARQAEPGASAMISGPGGAYSPDADADWHLLVGDESALPAIAVAVEQLPPDAVGHVFVEVHDAAEQLPVAPPPGVELHWLHRGEDRVGEQLVAAVSALDPPSGSVHAFVHGEAGFVKRLRHLLRVEHGVPLERLSISGYWRLGDDDAGWRAAKLQWNAEIADDEAAAGLA